jgi:hypothetical protein
MTEQMRVVPEDFHILTAIRIPLKNSKPFKGGILNTTINPDALDTGSFSWTVPHSQPIGSNFRIRISSTALPDIFDESDGDFTIDEGLETKAMPGILLLLLDD